MEKKLSIAITLALLFCTAFVSAAPSSGEKELLNQAIHSAIKDIAKDNAAFAKSHSPEHYKKFSDAQQPRVTVVLCSDSRVQVEHFSKSPENDMFVARNIGNQFETTKGSIEFGVDVLKTPALLIIGHSDCGAVKAARGDINHIEQSAIRKELATLDVKTAPDDKQGIVLNVHHQVESALADFKEKVNAGHLAVIGAVYDFRNDYGDGHGQLIIVNLNGEKDPKKIRESQYFHGMKDVSIGIPSKEPEPQKY